MSEQLSQEFPSLSTPWVRALAWCCFAKPPLDASQLPAAPPPLPLTNARQCWLQALDEKPQALLDWLDQRCRSPRLGLVFECLWHFFLDQDPETELIANNLPIRDGDRSVGELDILYRCHQRNTVVHLELAVKFYLDAGRPLVPGEAHSRWLGPDRRDRLDKKLARLREHQLPLPHSQWGKQVLADRGIEEWQTELVFAGRLFEAIDASTTEKELPANSWIHWREWQMSELRSLNWQHLQKPDWFTNLGQRAELPTQGPSRPIMLSQNQHRLMLCPDDWPQT